MSVIITDMDMPKENNCRFCEKDCFWQGADVDRKDHIEDCPLKSVDGLIDAVATISTKYFKGYQGVVYVDYNKVLEVVKEYCEVEDRKEGRL